jgi:tetratricopeptide (TPR) repeat protein
MWVYAEGGKMSKETTIILSIRETGTSTQRAFMFNILLDGEIIASNQSLSLAESQTMRDLSHRYSVLFEQRRQPHITSDNLKAFGAELFNVWLAKSWSKITAKVPVGALRLLVIASDVADILNLPWELLRPTKGDFLGFDLKFSIRRLPWQDKILPAFEGQLLPPPLRIFFMACSPRDQPELDYEREEEFLFQAIGKAGYNVVIDSGDMGSFEELRQRINEFQPHIVHLTGHGIVKDDGLGYFAFENERGDTDLRSSMEIRQELFAGSNVQCAFISGCQSGKAPPVEALGGICQGLVGEEVPLAIGWAASIADNIANHFAATFYNTLAAGQPVDRALTQARLAIKKLCEEQGDPSWTLPVLYSATSQRLLFDPRSLPVPLLRKSMVQKPLPGMIEGYAKQFIGRRREIQELLPALRESSLQTVLITGLGGTGKSTLATRLARKLEADGFIPIPVPSSKDNPLSAARLMQICGDAFLEAGLHDAYSTLRDSQIPVNDRLRYIITALNKNRFLLVLDNFEVNIDESTRKILAPELAGFYTHMISNLAGESRVIITSRYMPADVLVMPSIVREKPLGDFPESSFIKFMLLDEIVEQRYYKKEISYALLSRLYELLGGTPRFLGQIREVLKTIKAEELGRELDAVKLPDKEKPALLQQARDKYCENIFTLRLYGYLKPDSQKALSKVAVYGIPVNLSGMKAVTGEPEEKLQRFTREWQDYALAYPELAAGGLWVVYGLLRSWLLAPERLSSDKCKAAHKAAGDFLNELVEKNRTSELGMNPLDVALEARSQYISAGNYENAIEITERISHVYRLQGLYGEIQQLNEELLGYCEHPKILAQIAWSHLDRSNYDAARKWYQCMFDAAKETNEYETARALHGIATIDVNQGDYEVARKEFIKALEIRQQIGDKTGEAAALHGIATIDANQGDYEAARKEFIKALEIRQQIGDRAGEANTLHQLATIDVDQGDYEAARKGFVKALEIKQQIGDRAGEAYTLHNLATIDLRKGDYEAAREGFVKALEIYQQIGDRAGGAYTLHQLASIDLRKGDYEAARKGFVKALEIFQQIGDKKGEAAALHGIATIDVNQGDYEAAREGFVKALEIYQQIGDRAGEASAWYQLGMLAVDLDRLADGIKLMAICFLTDSSISHADAESDFNALVGMATQLKYTEEQFKTMLKEVAEAYQKDTGVKLLEEIFGRG